MVLWVLRGLFVALIGAVGFSAAGDPSAVGELSRYRLHLMIAAIVLAAAMIAVDLFVPRKSLAALSGAFLGLIVGMVVAYGLGLVLDLVIESYSPQLAADNPAGGGPAWRVVPDKGNQTFRIELDPAAAAETGSTGHPVIVAIKLLIGIVCCYLAISFILQTKDDIRFVIPYVEFAKQSRGARPLILDTSVIIDGRIADICETRIIDSELLIPRFVLQELQTIADSSDKLKRNRGRRGLDMLNKLQTNDKVEIKISDTRLPTVEEAADVDQKLVELAKKIDGRIVTNDYNLNKIAQLRGVEVININDLANAMKPVVMPGETLTVKIIKPGEEAGQGVGYLEDGTMIVAENSREKIGQEVTLIVTSVLQTSAGRMIFGRPEGEPLPPRRPRQRA